MVLCCRLDLNHYTDQVCFDIIHKSVKPRFLSIFRKAVIKKYTVKYVTGSVHYPLMEYKSVYTHTCHPA